MDSVQTSFISSRGNMRGDSIARSSCAIVINISRVRDLLAALNSHFLPFRMRSCDFKPLFDPTLHPHTVPANRDLRTWPGFRNDRKAADMLFVDFTMPCGLLNCQKARWTIYDSGTRRTELKTQVHKRSLRMTEGNL